jgi:hypothetical protein
VVIDTPGLNAIGAEPELTLGCCRRRMPRCSCWRPTPASPSPTWRSGATTWATGMLERFVVLNKIDALYDPLISPEEVQQQIQTQRERWPQTLGLRLDRVFALSARDGLAARMSGQRRRPEAQPSANSKTR